MSTPHRRPSRAVRLYRALLRAFPVDFRLDHARELEQTFDAQRRDAAHDGDTIAITRLWLDAVRDALTTAPREHITLLRQDVAYAARVLKRAPVFTGTAIATLALGIGAMASMFTIVNAVMLRPLPVADPGRLVSISNRTGSPYTLSFLDLQEYRAQRQVLTDAIGYAPRPATLNADGGGERVTVQLVTDNYFSMLGLQPAAGRLIQPAEGRAPGDAPVVVLAHEHWARRFRGDAGVIGRTVRLNGRPYTVIGVAEQRFRGTEALIRIDAYVPAWRLDDFNEAGAAASVLDDRGFRQFTSLGRLAPGVSVDQARTALNITASSLAREFPATHAGLSLNVVPEAEARPNPEIGPFLRVASTAMAGLAALLLLITSASVANLLLARAGSRTREVAVRTALGARRGRIVRQMVTEAVVLAVIASIVAIPIVVLATSGLHALIAGVSGAAAIDPDFGVDVRVLAAMLAMAVAAGVAAGVTPALAACRAGRSDLVGALTSGRGGNGPLPRLRGVRSPLVAVQIALSLALLVSSALFVRSLERAREVDLGFEPEGILLASTLPGLAGLDGPQRLAFYQSVRERIAGLPGVENAAWVMFPPLGIIGEIAEVSPAQQPSEPGWRPPSVSSSSVSAEYFATARVRLLAGRNFDDRDAAGRPPVVIVNDTLANQFWPDRTAVGQRLILRGATLEIVGVVNTGKYRNVWEPPRGAIFVPMAQFNPARATIVVRTSRAPSDLAKAVQGEIRAVAPDVAMYDVRPMTEHLDNGSAFFVFRIGALLASLFGGMGLLIASIGLYGIVAYHVSQRTTEFGIRRALGARRADIVRDVLGRAARVGAIGLIVGIVLAAGLAAMLRPLLVGVSPFDPLIYAAVAGVLAGICVVASLVPAWRATVVEPLEALRAD
jgi:predicted permease